jgi:hypothetical protein
MFILKGVSSSILLFKMNSVKDKSCCSAVGIMTGYGPDEEGPEFESQQGEELSLPHNTQTGCGAHPASKPMGRAGSRVKRQERKADHFTSN